MSHFSPKTLSFYAVAIGSVVILFNAVSSYGEANVKAPTAIGGNYRISNQNLPECLKSDSLLLTIQQSGIYLSGSLLAVDKTAEPKTTAEEKPSLNGNFHNQQVSLSGSIPHFPACNNPGVNIEGTVNGKNLQGKITLSSIPTPVEFTAPLEQPVKQQENH
ncbi:MAG TPA: hypothetical protein V6D12_12795 [Candidatus Obscuribacterales bacterium]